MSCLNRVMDWKLSSSVLSGVFPTGLVCSLGKMQLRELLAF